MLSGASAVPTRSGPSPLDGPILTLQAQTRQDEFEVLRQKNDALDPGLQPTGQGYLLVATRRGDGSLG